jgi:hypothetical protein
MARILCRRIAAETRFGGMNVPQTGCIGINICRPLSSSSSQSVVELREDVVSPQHMNDYLQAITKNDVLRNVSPKQLRFVSRLEVGGTTNVFSHAYFFPSGLPERQALMSDADQEHALWKDLDSTLAPFLQSQQNSLFVEAALIQQMDLAGMAGQSIRKEDSTSNDNTILEYRRYYLKLGYDTVPNFLKLYGAGLPSKLNARGTDPSTSLVTLLYSEVGRLNEVIEIWRHGDGVTAMETSRVAARGASEWRSAIASIANLAIEFRSTIHRPIIL